MAHKIIWRGRQWKVDCRGNIDLLGKRPYYIHANRLAETEPGSNGTRSDWLLHLTEKEWIDIEDFIAAWQHAVVAARTDLGDIDVAASIDEARQLDAQRRAS
jgi:hypothetical protein